MSQRAERQGSQNGWLYPFHSFHRKKCLFFLFRKGNKIATGAIFVLLNLWNLIVHTLLLRVRLASRLLRGLARGLGRDNRIYSSLNSFPVQWSLMIIGRSLERKES
jgi:hypothetical protein